MTLVGRAGGWTRYRRFRVWGPLLLGAASFGIALWASDRITFGGSQSALDAAHVTLYVALAAIGIALIGIPLAQSRIQRSQEVLFSRVAPYLTAKPSLLEGRTADGLAQVAADLRRLERLFLRHPDNPQTDAASLAVVRAAQEKVTKRLSSLTSSGRSADA